MDSIANIDDFGAIGNGVHDDSEAINKAIQSLAKQKGGVLYIPAKTYAISKELYINVPGIYIRGASPYFSVFKILDDFSGRAAVVFEPDSFQLSKGVGVDAGLTIDCNNKMAHGLLGIRLYDQVSLRNVEIKNVHSEYSGFRFAQDKEGYNVIGQSLLLENCYAERATNIAVTPMYYFDRYQEVNLIGCKSFSSVPNSDTPQGDAFYLKDCKGISFTGCSAAFSQNAITLEAQTKNISGISIVGQTNEKIVNYALNTIAIANNTIENVTVLPLRNELSGGAFSLKSCTKATIYAMDMPVSIDSKSSQNIIFSTSPSKVSNLARGNTIFGLANFDVPGFSILDAFTINGFTSDPTFYLSDSTGQMKSRIEQKYSNLRFLIRESDGYKLKFALLKDNLNNASNIQLSYTVNNVVKTERVLLGAPDSGGTGFRQLIIPN